MSALAAAAWRVPRLRGLPWVTWRQHRLALAGVVAVLGAIGLVLLVNGLAMRDSWHHLGLGRCTACGPQWAVFEQKYYNWALQLPRFVMFLPGVLGMFVGAPLLAREYETGTYRFAWTQGRSPTQWIIAKLVMLAVVLAVLALGFSALFAWWFEPWAPSMGRITSGQAYETEGVVFAARTLFGFALGALLGAVIRRTVAAMAATAASWLAVAWPTVVYLRPLLEKPLVAAGDSAPGNGWALSHWWQDASGHHVGFGALLSRSEQSPELSTDTWLAQHGYTQWTSYQPNSRFWHFQVVEAGSYVALALLLAVATVWWIRRRAT